MPRCAVRSSPRSSRAGGEAQRDASRESLSSPTRWHLLCFAAGQRRRNSSTGRGAWHSTLVEGALRLGAFVVSAGTLCRGLWTIRRTRRGRASRRCTPCLVDVRERPRAVRQPLGLQPARDPGLGGDERHRSASRLGAHLPSDCRWLDPIGQAAMTQHRTPHGYGSTASVLDESLPRLWVCELAAPRDPCGLLSSMAIAGMTVCGRQSESVRPSRTRGPGSSVATSSIDLDAGGLRGKLFGHPRQNMTQHATSLTQAPGLPGHP